MRKTMWIVAAAALAGAPAAYSQPFGRGPREGAGHPVMGGFLHAMNRLELSDQQREEISCIMEDAEALLEELADTEAGSSGIVEYFCSDGFSRSGLESMLNLRIERMRRINGITAEAMASVRAVLTPGQLQELAGMERERCTEHRTEGMGHHREGMAPPHREMF